MMTCCVSLIPYKEQMDLPQLPLICVHCVDLWIVVPTHLIMLASLCKTVDLSSLIYYSQALLK